jgi:hypothetical protein
MENGQQEELLEEKQSAGLSQVGKGEKQGVEITVVLTVT